MQRQRSRVSMAMVHAHQSLRLHNQLRNAMSEANQHDPKKETATGSLAHSADGLPVSKFEVVPYGDRVDEKELFAFRESIPAPVEPVVKKKPSPAISPAKVFLLVALVVLIVVTAFAVPVILRMMRPVAYMDLGSQRFDPRGLSGRMIARWETSASYQLFLDPVGPQQADSFAAVAADPPRQFSVTIRLLDAKGLVTCQKQILFPAPVPPTPNDSGSAPPQGPRQTDTGDTVENMIGQSGKIEEIALRGPLPCPEKAYVATKTWDFASDFPTQAEEDEWLRQEKSSAAKSHGGNQSVRTARMPGPIEGDDVIIADNPSRGTVQTGGGHVFLLGVAGMRSRTAEWQVFPVTIHFRCDKKGFCALTRANTRVTLLARLLK